MDPDRPTRPWVCWSALAVILGYSDMSPWTCCRPRSIIFRRSSSQGSGNSSRSRQGHSQGHLARQVEDHGADGGDRRALDAQGIFLHPPGGRCGRPLAIPGSGRWTRAYLWSGRLGAALLLGRGGADAGHRLATISARPCPFLEGAFMIDVLDFALVRERQSACAKEQGSGPIAATRWPELVRGAEGCARPLSRLPPSPTRTALGWRWTRDLAAFDNAAGRAPAKWPS